MGTIEEVPIDDVVYLQTSCSATFKNREDVENLIQALIDGEQDPLVDPTLILNVAKALKRRPELRAGPGKTPRTAIYYSMDHRRLYAMRQAGCEQVRVQVQLSGRFVDEFINKARDRLGEPREITLRSNW